MERPWTQERFAKNEAQKKSLVPVRRALVLVALLALGLAAWTTWRYVRVKAAISPIRSIAVLPLSNLSGDPSEEYFADGMTDQLITDLAKVGSLRVISRTSVMQYKGTREITQRFGLFIGHPHCRQISVTMAACELQRIPAIRLHPVSGLFRNQLPCHFSSALSTLSLNI